MEIYDFLFSGKPFKGVSKLLYRVDDAVSKKLNGDSDPPEAMEESKLVLFLAGTYNKTSAAVTYANQFADNALKSHMTACAKKLKETYSSVVKREMIGEIYAAVRCKMNGWAMVRGYGGSGHTGIDQIWKYKETSGQYKGPYLVVVEAKGGRGKLSDRLSYQTSYSSKGVPVVLNRVSYSQMSVDWIFIVADAEVQSAFVYLVGKLTSNIPKATDGAQAACWLICTALYNPSDYHGKATVGAMRRAMATALGLKVGTKFVLHGVRGTTITNGVTIQDQILAIPIHDWTFTLS